VERVTVALLVVFQHCVCGAVYWSVIASISGLEGCMRPAAALAGPLHLENYPKALTILPFHLFGTTVFTCACFA